MTITVGSLFAGIGGLDLGLELAGMVVKWQVEIDPFCQKVLAKHWPDVKRYDDITKLRGNELEYVDLICGGFPCQDISCAGKRIDGIEGDQSSLFFELARIVREIRPKYILLENSPDLRYRGIDRVLGELAEIGYNTEWHCIPASAVGAPHRRDRIFIFAYAESQYGKEGHMFFACRTPPGQKRQIEVWDSSEFRRLFSLETWSEEDGTRANDGTPILYRKNDGFPSWVDRLRALGNAVVPQVAEYIGRCIIEFDSLGR